MCVSITHHFFWAKYATITKFNTNIENQVELVFDFFITCGHS